MNRLGLAVPILIWNTISCLTGWATARYGLFGVPEGVPSSIVLNYLGVAVLVVGSSFFLFIKSHVYKPKDAEKPTSAAEFSSEKSWDLRRSDVPQYFTAVSQTILRNIGAS
uniref:Uncharacterized protein n=1 Tax=Caenorhabditis japonica TaxID=281687 RepID=A0A8R1EA90_CAEJA